MSSGFVCVEQIIDALSSAMFEFPTAVEIAVIVRSDDRLDVLIAVADEDDEDDATRTGRLMT